MDNLAKDLINGNRQEVDSILSKLNKVERYKFQALYLHKIGNDYNGCYIPIEEPIQAKSINFGMYFIACKEGYMLKEIEPGLYAQIKIEDNQQPSLEDEEGSTTSL